MKVFVVDGKIYTILTIQKFTILLLVIFFAKVVFIKINILY